MCEGDLAELPKLSAKEQLQEAMKSNLNDILTMLIEKGQRLQRSRLLSSEESQEASSSAKEKFTCTLTRLWHRLVDQDWDKDKEQGQEQGKNQDKGQGQDKGQDKSQNQDKGQNQSENQSQSDDLLMPPSNCPHDAALMIRQTLEQVKQLKEDHKQTDAMIDKLLHQATKFNQELIHCNKVAKKRRVRHELKAKY